MRILARWTRPRALPPDNARPLIVGVGPVPPPIHGAAVVTAAVWSALRASVDLVEVDTAVGNRGAVSYHITRLVRHVAALTVVIRHRRRRSRGVYVTCPGGLALWYLVVLAGVARLLGYRIVIHHHSFAYLDQWSVPMRFLVRLTNGSATHVLLCDDMRRRFDCTYRPAARLTVCSNAAWIPDGISIAVPKPVGHLKLGYLGRLTASKGLVEVLQTLGGLLDAGVDADLHIAGPLSNTTERRLLKEKQAKYGERLRISGELTGSAKEDFFRSIDAFLFPSRYVHEAEPLVILEALAAGVQIIAYARGCIAEVICERGGLVIAPGSDFVSIAVPHLATLTDAPSDLATGRAAARSLFEQHRTRAEADRRVMFEAIAGHSSSKH